MANWVNCVIISLALKCSLCEKGIISTEKYVHVVLIKIVG